MTTSNQELQEALQFLENLKPTFARYDQQQYAKSLRNEVTANWIDSFMTTMQNSSDSAHMINKETGIKHTVESLVAELQARVGLDGLMKQAKRPVALSKRAKEELPEDISDENLIKKIHEAVELVGLKPTGGFISTEALLNIVKERFDSDIVERFGRDRLIELLTTWRDRARDMTEVDSLPQYNGEPIPIGSEQSAQNDNIFSNLETAAK